MAGSGRERSGRPGRDGPGRFGRARDGGEKERPRPKPRRGPPRTDVPQEVGRVVREALGGEAFRRGLALGRLARSWEAVVGPRLARETAPQILDPAGLVVSASSGAWGTQVRFLADDIRRRANDVLGAEEVRAVRVVVAGEGSRRAGSPPLTDHSAEGPERGDYAP